MAFFTYSAAGMAETAALAASRLMEGKPKLAKIRLEQVQMKSRWMGSSALKVSAEGHLLGPDQKGAPSVVV